MMYSSTTRDVQNEFQMAIMQHRAKSLHLPSDWKKASDIIDNYKHDREKLIKTYEDEYTTRFEKALRIRIDKAGAKTKDLKHPFAHTDSFNSGENQRQAHRDVQRDHECALVSLKNQVVHAFDMLVAKAEHRDSLHQKPTKDFSKSVDRRRNKERRSEKRLRTQPLKRSR